jgi:hypothetical protein
LAQLILSTVGAAVGARIAPAALRTLGASLGRAAGSAVGARIDAALFDEPRRVEGPRLTDLHLQTSTEGASIPLIYGRARIAGQVIWAARFKETVTTTRVSTGGKGGGGVTATNYRYSLSFAVGLCEGPAARIAQVWANGRPLDLSTVAWRFHPGTEDQAPDPLIEAIEGEGAAPAYRGLAYIVFEDLPLAAFGDAIPQLSFEIVRSAVQSDAPNLEQLAKGVCLIPGAGEFVYASAPVHRRLGPGREASENLHAEAQRADFEVALDQLAADLPACESVLLVVSWFGTDLRAGECQIRPGVETPIKSTSSIAWRAGGVDRAGAHAISLIDGSPAFGGTPADATVVSAIRALKARGYRVGLYPFILMDVPPGNGAPDPHGGPEQAAYPWRGRIAAYPPSVDKTPAAGAQAAAFFGSAQAHHFSTHVDSVTYSGPAEWGFRRFILHCAALAAAAGGVDAFVLGSELKGLTALRDGPETFPVVTALRALAADVRSLIGPAPTLTYGADWTEYAGIRPQDGTGDVFFHLDPLWADPAISCVGVDWYPPLSDWRDGLTHADAATAKSAHDRAYLASGVEGGQDFDWFYPDEAARAAQARAAITDGAYAKPWVFRAKDLRGFWENLHFDRPGGVERATPTPWAPQSKPIWLLELGCPAVDKGANAPNVFPDPKSSESAAPPFSSGQRDDLIQRRLIETYLDYWRADGGRNPTSPVYGGPMIDPAGVHLWCWDARPYPAFPTRTDVWSDGANWRLGHWLNGRAGLAELPSVAADLCARAGVTDVDVSGLTGAVSGYVVDAPTNARAALEPLLQIYGAEAAERDGRLRLAHAFSVFEAALTPDNLIDDGRSPGPVLTRAASEQAPEAVRLRFVDPQRDHRLAEVSVRAFAGGEGVAVVTAPLALDTDMARAVAERLLIDAHAALDTAEITLPLAAMAAEPGDIVTLDGAGAYRIVRAVEGAERRLELVRAVDNAPMSFALATPSAPSPPPSPAQPVALLIDVADPAAAPDDPRPAVAVFAEPWGGATTVYVGMDAATATQRAVIEHAADIGETLWELWPGCVGRWDDGNRVRARLPGAHASATADATLNGANLFALETPLGWEVFQARDVQLIAPGDYELSGLLRGLAGTDPMMGAPTPAGARLVRLDARVARLDLRPHEEGEALTMIAARTAYGRADPRGSTSTVVWQGASARCWAPAHLRLMRLNDGAVHARWVRRARFGGEGWGPAEPPMGAAVERYQVRVLADGVEVRSVIVSAAEWTYPAAWAALDLAGVTAASLAVAQVGDGDRVGWETESPIPG